MIHLAPPALASISSQTTKAIAAIRNGARVEKVFDNAGVNKVETNPVILIQKIFFHIYLLLPILEKTQTPNADDTVVFRI